MNTKLTVAERDLIIISLITRTRHIEKLIHDWEKDGSTTAMDLVEIYGNEKIEIEALKQKYIDLDFQ